jgi:hypothetical protein
MLAAARIPAMTLTATMAKATSTSINVKPRFMAKL